MTEEKQKGGEMELGRGADRSTDLGFSEIKLHLGTTNEELKCLINGALETRLNSSKIPQK